MRLTLEFTPQQTSVFKSILEEAVQVASVQESVVQDAIAKEIDPESINNMNNFVVRVSSQRVLCAEILHTMSITDPDNRIVLPS